MSTSWYQIANIDELDTPALVVYPERVRQNIARAIRMVLDAARLRPHVKTHKSPAVTRLMLEAGIRQFKCATIAEAEMLAVEGAPDVLLAYQPVGPKVGRLVQLIRQYPGTRFSCLIDHADAAAAIAAKLRDAGLVLPVYLDLNVGMDRTGISPGPEAAALYRKAMELDGIDPVGLHVYDGHIRDNDPDVLRRKCDEAFRPVLALKAAIGADLAIIAGGSPTFPVHAGRAAEIQCSPGTFVYWDKGYGDQFPEQPFTPDALVVTRVISLRGDGRLCLDLGHKSIAAENELGRRVFFLNGPELRAVGQSEEHLVVEAGAGHSYRIGDVFYGVPYHVCPTVALYERAITIEEGRATGEWKNVARDRKISV
ncbi:MAG TPA: D-TA family PLP-dependent enzyme [Puia sp.]|jgi:D-serine deaminase-like pyridoxal phosphate-dependent protein|nr:D-TA family PLP-dependent enzyme [Puia sp.]